MRLARDLRFPLLDLESGGYLYQQDGRWRMHIPRRKGWFVPQQVGDKLIQSGLVVQDGDVYRISDTGRAALQRREGGE